MFRMRAAECGRWLARADVAGGTSVVAPTGHEVARVATSDPATLDAAVGRERGTLQAAGRSLELKIRTTRVFRFVGGRWRQVHHHGSIDDATLLARYQAAVR